MKKSLGKGQGWFAGLTLPGKSQLRNLGIDPQKALAELHVRDESDRIVTELHAYILLMGKVSLLKPIAWLVGLPLIRPVLAKIYHRQVNRRLKTRACFESMALFL
jgi:predicted DCC family thiol-disulfide oxidoreductase YuxK